MQCACVQAHGRLGNACAGFLDLVHVLQHWERSLTNERHRQRLDLTSLTLADNRANLGGHGVLDVDHALDNRNPWVDRHGQAVQRVAHDRRFDLLDIHHGIRNRHTKEIVRLRIWAERRKRRHVAWLVHQDLVTVATGADLTQLRDPVAVVINAHIVLDIENLLHRRIVALVHFVGQRRIACETLDVGVHVFIRRRQLRNLVGLVTHGDQL